MIPRHSHPFGFGRILSLCVLPGFDVPSSDLEKAYADTLGVTSALLLPSVRAGIHMTIQAAGRPGLWAVIPVYTCNTVHKALALSGARRRLVDSAPDSFLMPTDAIAAAAEPDCILLLSEVYGIPYDVETIEKACRAKPRLRVLDLAMCIPSPERMQLLKAGEVALYSFGWGKPMYAGWGGIACFRDSDLAGRVREIRDEWIIPESPGLRLRRGVSTLLRVAMNQRFLYGLWHERRLYRLYRDAACSQNKQRPPSTAGGCALPPASSLGARALPPEWTRPMTALNRNLALFNLRQAAQNSDLRRSQAEIYFSRLVEPGIVRGPVRGALPQSHFPIRLPSALRNRMCDYLRGCGIDTSTLFPLPAGLNAACYPHAAAAAGEVVTLPLGPAVALDEVRRESERVKDGVRALGYKGNDHP